MVTVKELMAAMSSVVLNMAVKVVDWTTTIDDRCIPATIGFFFELAGNQGVHGSRRIRSLAHETCFFFIRRGHGPPSLRSCTHTATFTRRVDMIKQKCRLGHHIRFISQTHHPSRTI